MVSCKFMAKVIIEVKSLQNNDLIGKLVISNSGRDKNQMYVIVDNIDDSYYLLSNGKTKTIQMPKKKKIKHILIHLLLIIMNAKI